MDKNKLIAAILAANCGFVEADREALTALNDKQLESLANFAKEHPTVNFALERKDGKVTFIAKNKPESAAANAGAAPITTPPVAAPATQPAAAPATNTQQTQSPKVVSAEEYIQAAPPQVREMLTNGLAAYNEEKKQLVDSILANERNIFQRAELESKPLTELKAIARLAAQQQTAAPGNVAQLPPNYSGMAPVPTGNTQTPKVEVLPLPVMNFDKPKKGAAA